jgi:DNA-binding transcriptional regulator GbsR (MarR family)
MKLTQSMQDFILHWGEMGSVWGTNRSVAQIHALLHISPDPLTADEICDALGLARSNVSTGLKELQAWGLVKPSRKLGDRRDHFTSIRDMFDLVDQLVAERRARAILPTMEALRRVQAEALEDGTSDKVRDRMVVTLETMELYDRWYQDVHRLPRKVQLTLLNLGAKVARFLPGAGKG